TIARAEKMQAQGAAIDAPRPRTVPALAAARVVDNIETDPMRGFASAADFGQAVRAACNPSGPSYDPRLQVLGAPTNFHRETSSADGYMVPPAMRDAIWALVFGDEGLLATTMPEPTASNSVQLLADESTPWGATGIQANWAAEGSQFTSSRLATVARNVVLHKLHAFVLGSDELLSDAPRLANRLTTGAARAIAYKADESIVNGNGVGQPLGWSGSGAVVSVAKESGQAAATVVATNVAKMFARCILSPSSYWLVNQDVLPQLMTMTLGDNSVWTPPSTGFANAPGGFLLGRPIRFSEHCATLGTVNDIQLVNPAGYYSAVRESGVQFAQSMHLYFDYGVEAFRWTFRLGGQPYLSAPVTPDNGSNTRSHFITLATRA
ncbi:MAG: phage major capsid protein, partial [Desulfurellales bacterium]